MRNKRFAMCNCGFIFEHKHGYPLCRFNYRVFCKTDEYLTKREKDKLLKEKQK